MSKPDGGPAFPGARVFSQAVFDIARPTEGLNVARAMATSESGGMSLLQWYAGQALAGLLTHADLADVSDDEITYTCFAIADAMIEEVSNREPRDT